MTGNKNDNGVLEIGTDEIRKAYSEDTPGQNVESFIKEQEKAFHESKDRQKKHFSQVFGNPLQGYPHNEEFEVKEIKEEVELDENIQKIVKMLKKSNELIKKCVEMIQRIIKSLRRSTKILRIAINFFRHSTIVLNKSTNVLRNSSMFCRNSTEF